MADRIDPETAASALIAHAHDSEPEPEAYLVRAIAEVFAREPGVLGHIVDKWFTDLTEELGRRGQEDARRAVLEVEERWRQEV